MIEALLEEFELEGALIYMFKRIGMSLLLVFTMLASTLNFGNGFTPVTVYAAPACLTISECIDAASEARDNIEQIVGQENELNEKIADLNGRITTLRGEIENLELSINTINLQISDLETEIADNVELLEETEEEIEKLMELVRERMIITQRMDGNVIMSLLSESLDLTDFIGQVRFFSRIANTDADVMDQLNDLINQYDDLIETLSNQATTLAETQEGLEARQVVLEDSQEELLELEGELREEIYELGVERMTEEEALAAAEEAREILERTPPPPTTTNGSSSTATPGDLDLNTGLTHPMPAGRGNVTSEFGPRSLDGFHWGIDWAAPGFPPILAAASGTVIRNTYNPGGYGWYVIIAHNINDQRVDTLYAHFHSQSPIEAGTVVAQGEVIGTQGSTGFSTGPHLHFEVHPGGFAGNSSSVDPRQWIGNP